MHGSIQRRILRQSIRTGIDRKSPGRSSRSSTAVSDCLVHWSSGDGRGRHRSHYSAHVIGGQGSRDQVGITQPAGSGAVPVAGSRWGEGATAPPSAPGLLAPGGHCAAAQPRPGATHHRQAATVGGGLVRTVGTRSSTGGGFQTSRVGGRLSRTRDRGRSDAPRAGIPGGAIANTIETGSPGGHADRADGTGNGASTSDRAGASPALGALAVAVRDILAPGGRSERVRAGDQVYTRASLARSVRQGTFPQRSGAGPAGRSHTPLSVVASYHYRGWRPVGVRLPCATAPPGHPSPPRWHRSRSVCPPGASPRACECAGPLPRTTVLLAPCGRCAGCDRRGGSPFASVTGDCPPPGGASAPRQRRGGGGAGRPPRRLRSCTCVKTDITSGRTVSSNRRRRPAPTPRVGTVPNAGRRRVGRSASGDRRGRESAPC